MTSLTASTDHARGMGEELAEISRIVQAEEVGTRESMCKGKREKIDTVLSTRDMGDFIYCLRL